MPTKFNVGDVLALGEDVYVVTRHAIPRDLVSLIRINGPFRGTYDYVFGARLEDAKVLGPVGEFDPEYMRSQLQGEYAYIYQRDGNIYMMCHRRVISKGESQ